MLILSRHEGEGLSIGEGIRIVVLGHDHRGVRLGIEAPSDVRILRDELAAAVRTENQRAAVPPRAWLEIVPASATPKAWLEAVPLSPTPRVTPLIGSA
ncbi:MAG: carbon storage regulator [Gemmatimonadetes bacterium]|nr:carbon storage regulator [Gemmatimonadota bacterium]